MYEKEISEVPGVLDSFDGVTVNCFEKFQNRKGYYLCEGEIDEKPKRVMEALRNVYANHTKYNTDMETAAYVAAVQKTVDMTHALA